MVLNYFIYQTNYIEKIIQTFPLIFEKIQTYHQSYISFLEQIDRITQYISIECHTIIILPIIQKAINNGIKPARIIACKILAHISRLFLQDDLHFTIHNIIINDYLKSNSYQKRISFIYV